MSDEENTTPQPPAPPRHGAATASGTSATPRSGYTLTPPPGTKPEFSTQSTLSQDARALGSEIKQQANPRRIAANAALALTGAKSVVDAAKQTNDAAKASGEASQGESRTGKRAASPRTPESPASPAPAGKHAAPQPPTEESGASQRRPAHATKKDEASSGGTKKGKAAAAQGATAKGLDVAGSALGVKKAGKFVRASDSKGGLTGDAKSVASGATSGVKIGAKVAGPAGAAIGGTAGAALQGMKTKNGRRWLLFGATAPLWAPLAVIVALSMALTMFISPGTSEAMNNSADELALAAATKDGMSEAVIRITAEAAGEAGLPWEVMAAVVKVSGNVANEDEAEPLSADEVKDAKADNTPVGPYSVLLKDLDNAVHFTDEPGRADPDQIALSTKPFSDRAALFARMEDYRTSTEVMARVLGSTMAQMHPDLDSFGLGAGIVLASAEEENQDVRRAFEPEAGEGETSQTGETLDPNGNSIDEANASGVDGNAESRALRRAYVEALSTLPVENAAENAEAIYDQAMAWYMGQTATCVPGAGAVSGTGMWANPIVAPISSPYGMRFHPVRLVMSLHDGTDLSAGQGSVVHAAGSGTVSVVNESWSGTNNLVIIDHGGGATTEYGHMSKVLIESGTTISAGQPVGQVGSEGLSTGPHLHFIATEAGKTVDPVPFMTARGVALGVDDPAKPVGSVDTTTEGEGVAPPSQVGPDEVRLIHTNLARTHTTPAKFKADLDKAAALGPDFITLNEVSLKSAKEITPSGYATWRASGVKPITESTGTAIAWRTDKWTVRDKGRDQITKSSTLIDNRWAHWVTLTNAGGQAISVISTHAMTNPKDSGPARQATYRAGMEALNERIADLSGDGAVLLGGDLNSWHPRTGGVGDPWGPTAVLAKSKMTSTFVTLGQPAEGWATHDGGGTIDYIFYQTNNGLTPMRHSIYNQNSDHKAIIADFKLGDATGQVVPSGASLPESFTAKSAQGEQVTLDSTQVGYAATIAAKGAEMGVPDEGVIIAFMTVLVETKFKNYASDKYPETIGKEYPAGAVGSDHDSVGLFQQRPQSGWGDPLDLLDPTYTAAAFFGGPQGPNGGSPQGLLDHPGWESMSKGVAAQDVQVSAFPDKYAHWEDSATELLGAVKGAGAVGSNVCAGAVSAPGGGFVVASLNVLGATQTAPGGALANWPDAEARMPDALEALDVSGATVAGLQELQAPQWKVVDDSDWDVFPESDLSSTERAVIWKPSDWSLLEGKRFSLTANGPEDQTYVRLKNATTSQEAYFLSVQTPTGTKKRDAALRTVKTLIKSLQGAEHPVFLTGSFPDHAAPFCALGDTMKSANGAGTIAPCRAPAGTTTAQIYVAGATEFSGVDVDTSLKTQKISDEPLIAASVGATSGSAQTAIDYAMKQVGKGYSQNAVLRMGPTHFDCSGLMFMAWKQAGVKLGTFTGTQQTDGTEVTRDDLAPGDLIFYYSPVSHVAMYIGERDGVPSIVHAANPSTGVVVAPLSEMEADIVSYRRVG